MKSTFLAFTSAIDLGIRVGRSSLRLFIVPAIVGVALVARGPSVDLAAAPVKNASVKFWLGDPSTPGVDNPGDKIQSDGGGIYQNGVDAVTAYIDKADNGRLVIYNGPRSPRQMWILLDTCLPTSTCDEFPFVERLGQVGFQTGPKNFDGSAVPDGLLGMAVGPAGERLAPFFTYLGDYDSAYWTLCKSLPDANTFCGASNNSTPARVVRTAADTWTFTAAATTVPRTDVSQLIKKTGNNRSTVITTQGSYVMPFTLTVQCVKMSECS